MPFLSLPYTPARPGFTQPGTQSGTRPPGQGASTHFNPAPFNAPGNAPYPASGLGFPAFPNQSGMATPTGATTSPYWPLYPNPLGQRPYQNPCTSIGGNGNPLAWLDPAISQDCYSHASDAQQPEQNSQTETSSSHTRLAMFQMFKIAGAVFALRMCFHAAPWGIGLASKAIEKQGQLNINSKPLKILNDRLKAMKDFMASRSQEHGSSLYKSMMAIMDGVMMLYVGGEVDRYFCKKSDGFQPKQSKDPEKMVDKVLLVLIATERMENIMHHLFHWLDTTPTTGRNFLYGELAALSAVMLDTTVKIASDRYKIKNNNAGGQNTGSQAKMD